MIIFIYGGDLDKLHNTLEEVKTKFLKENPTGTITTVLGDEAAADTLAVLSESTELFSSAQMVVLSDWCQDADAKDFLLEGLGSLVDSPKHFIVYEHELDARIAKRISSEANTTHVCNGEEKEESDFNIFSIANALGERDKKKLWMLLMQAFEEGVAPEEIHGTLFWQVKAMLLAKDAAEGREQSTGLSPFVLRNASRYAKNFSDHELSELSQELVDIYHRAHQGETEFSHALEKIALKI